MCDFQAARYLVDGVVPPQAGNDHPDATPMGVFATADGHLNIGVGGDGQWRAFCSAIGRPDLDSHANFATMEARFRNRPRLRELLEPIFKSKSTKEWSHLLKANSVPAGPIYKMGEVFADPQVRHLGIAELGMLVANKAAATGKRAAVEGFVAAYVSKMKELEASKDKFGAAIAQLTGLEAGVATKIAEVIKLGPVITPDQIKR